MDAKTLPEQEKDIRDLLRRAERTPIKTSALRKETFRRLIDLAHSPHSSLKVIAATNLKYFIRDFPDLEDDAINAVYDLCEDPVSNVRIKGYAAIVDFSREQTKWVKRNADVLVQLLQSDEPEEVTVVKRALTQHLDMDPIVTIGVLCDQVIPSDEPLDEEEQAIRDRLRSLVLAFLAGEAKRPLVERHANAFGTPTEQLLVSGLFKAITKLPPADIGVIVKDILAALPSFKSSSARGKELLDIILAQIRAALKADLSAGMDSVSLSSSRDYLDLASYIVVDKRLAPPADLLRFYYVSLAPKSVLGRLSEEDQAYVLVAVAQVFSAAEEMGPKQPPTAPAADLGKIPGSASNSNEEIALRRQFPDVCSVLLQVFADMPSEVHRPWTACLTLVQGIVRRKRDNRWQVPQHVISALRRLDTITATQEASAEMRAAQEQVHSVIRSLLEPIKPPAPPTTQTVRTTTPTRANADSRDEQKGNVKAMGSASNGNAYANPGFAGANAKGDQRRVMNIHKRKLDVANDPGSSSGSSAGPGHNSFRSPAVTGQPSRPARLSLPASLPARPSPATVASGAGGAPSAPRADRQRGRPPPPHLKGRASLSSPTTSGTPTGDLSNGASRPAQAEPESSRLAKRTKVEERGRNNQGSGSASQPEASSGKATESTESSKLPETSSAPSLLSRLAGSTTKGNAIALSRKEQEEAQRDRGGQAQGQGRRNKRDREVDRGGELPQSSTIPAKRPSISTSQSAPSPNTPSLLSAQSKRGHPPSSTDPDKDPVGGYSIRGAARATGRDPAGGGDVAASKGPGSLLERLQATGDGAGQGSDGGGRRKKRTKHS